MKAIAIIRERGQLTIPDSIRKTIKWTTPMSAVSITVVKPDEILIRPQQAYVDWAEIWAGIKKARAISGKAGAVSTVEFLERDRASH
jgi:bifunctional DNA-binding transcriptional regulator/antitoxin component of YhaV-PrlF toxin-antitoxin module